MVSLYDGLMNVTAAVITISDRAFADVYEDRSGPVARDALEAAGYPVTDSVIVPDDAEAIEAAIRAALTAGNRIVLTTGGTGASPRDVTVETTRRLIDFELPGLAEEVRRVGLVNTPLSLLSRGVVGCISASRAVIINAPGSRGGVRDTAAVVLPLMPHLLDQLDGKDHV